MLSFPRSVNIIHQSFLLDDYQSYFLYVDTSASPVCLDLISWFSISLAIILRSIFSLFDPIILRQYAIILRQYAIILRSLILSSFVNTLSSFVLTRSLMTLRYDILSSFVLTRSLMTLRYDILSSFVLSSHLSSTILVDTLIFRFQMLHLQIPSQTHENLILWNSSIRITVQYYIFYEM